MRDGRKVINYFISELSKFARYAVPNIESITKMMEDSVDAVPITSNLNTGLGMDAESSGQSEQPDHAK